MRKQILKKLGASVRQWLGASVAESEAWESSMLLSGRIAALINRSVDSIQSLADVEFKVFSQFGEDGIIEWLISRLPAIPPTFVEFGVEDYREANSRFLLYHRNWRGLIMDGSPENIAYARRRSSFWRYDLCAVAAFVDRDNINDLILRNGFVDDIGLLSIDVDGNDYWVWNAIEAVRPWIVVIEYNAVFGDIRPLTVPYDPNFIRSNRHFSNLYFGAGIGALVHLAKSRGYSLAGTNLAGNNAFFIRDDIFAPLKSRIADMRPRPSLFRESRSANGELSYARGAARAKLIADMAVVDVVSGTTIRLGEAGPLYGERWLEILGPE